MFNAYFGNILRSRLNYIYILLYSALHLYYCLLQWHMVILASNVSLLYRILFIFFVDYVIIFLSSPIFFSSPGWRNISWTLYTYIKNFISFNCSSVNPYWFSSYSAMQIFSVWVMIFNISQGFIMFQVKAENILWTSLAGLMKRKSRFCPGSD